MWKRCDKDQTRHAHCSIVSNLDLEYISEEAVRETTLN